MHYLVCMEAYCPKKRAGARKRERIGFDILSIFLLARIYFNIFLKDASALIYRLGERDMRALSRRFSSSGIFSRRLTFFATRLCLKLKCVRLI